MTVLLLPLFIIAIPVACIAWTVTHEELFRGFREFCERKSETSKNAWTRKFFYIFTCEYCFSHYVAIFFIFITNYALFFPGWRGYLLSFFSVVFIANIYMSLFAKIRIDIKKEKKTIEKIEQSM